MRQTQKRGGSAFLAFGTLISPRDAFDELIATRGWKIQHWEPTFVEPSDRNEIARARQRLARDGAGWWEDRQVLRRPGAPVDAAPEAAGDIEPRVMVAPSSELPTLHF